MQEEISVGALVFNDNYEFLFLRRRDKKDYWEFPKGHKEEGEDELTTLKRELKEECNLTDYKIVDGFRRVSSYINSRNNLRIIVVYLVKTNQEIKLSDEHEQFAWLNKEETRKLFKEMIQKHVIPKYSQWLEIAEDAFNYLQI